jgi:hypothetical protein
MGEPGPGRPRLAGAVASPCTREQLRREVWDALEVRPTDVSERQLHRVIAPVEPSVLVTVVQTPSTEVLSRRRRVSAGIGVLATPINQRTSDLSPADRPTARPGASPAERRPDDHPGRVMVVVSEDHPDGDPATLRSSAISDSRACSSASLIMPTAVQLAVSLRDIVRPCRRRSSDSSATDVRTWRLRRQHSPRRGRLSGHRP